jgi:hypothetical protein
MLVFAIAIWVLQAKREGLRAIKEPNRVGNRRPLGKAGAGSRRARTFYTLRIGLVRAVLVPLGTASNQIQPRLCSL